MNTLARKQTAYWITILLTAASLITTSFVLRQWDLSTQARLAITAVPLVLMVAAAGLFATVEKSKDEMFRRVQLETMAWAYPIAFIGIFATGLIFQALETEPLDFIDAINFLAIGYVIGYVITSRKYR